MHQEKTFNVLAIHLKLSCTPLDGGTPQILQRSFTVNFEECSIFAGEESFEEMCSNLFPIYLSLMSEHYPKDIKNVMDYQTGAETIFKDVEADIDIDTSVSKNFDIHIEETGMMALNAGTYENDLDINTKDGTLFIT